MQSREQANVLAGRGVAVSRLNSAMVKQIYLLDVDGKPTGGVEAKKRVKPSADLKSREFFNRRVYI